MRLPVVPSSGRPAAPSPVARPSRSHSQPRSDTQPCSQRFAYGCNLFLSIARPPELARFSLGRSRLRFVPVFSSHADLDRFAWLYGQASVAHGMVVSVGEGKPRSIETQLTRNAPAVKKLRALARIFRGPEVRARARARARVRARVRV